MDYPLHEQFMCQRWQRAIRAAGPGDIEGLKTVALQILDYAIVNRAYALMVAKEGLPKGNAPASEDAEAIAHLLSRGRDQDVKSSS